MPRKTADQVNGLRVLELGGALRSLKEQLARRLEGGSRTISTVGRRTKNEQEIAGMGHVLVVMFPLAIELALKSVQEHLRGLGNHDDGHKLDDLFRSLTTDAKDINVAKKAKEEARTSWKKFQKDGLVEYSGTLDQFLREHRSDFVNSRYYKPQNKILVIKDFEACFFSVLHPLIKRDPEVQTNFFSMFESEASRVRGLS